MADNITKSCPSVTYEASIASVGPLLLRINRKVKRKWREDITAKDLNEHLLCKICLKFLNNPATITRCMHSFCNTCLMDHIKKYRSCPTCLKLIHPLRPIVNIRKDFLLQRLVCKLFPLNMAAENKINDTNSIDNKNIADESNKTTIKRYPIFTGNEQISLSLNPSENSLGNYQENMQRYIQCSAKMPIHLLEKFVLSKLNLNAEKYMVNFKYDGKQDLKSTYKLMDVAYIFQWDQSEPLSLVFEIGSASSEEMEIQQLSFPIISIEPDLDKTIVTPTDTNDLPEKMDVENRATKENVKTSVRDINEESLESYVAGNMSSSSSPLNNHSESEGNNQLVEPRKKRGRKQKSLESVIMSLRPKQLQNDNGSALKNTDSIAPTKLPPISENIVDEIPRNKACACCKLVETSATISPVVDSTVLDKSPSKACQTDMTYHPPIKGLKKKKVPTATLR